VRELGEVGGQKQGGAGRGKNHWINTESTKYKKIQRITEDTKSDFFNFNSPTRY
jgi:hypothetical protein